MNAGELPLVDLGRALELLRAAAQRPDARFPFLVQEALSMTVGDARALDELGHRELRELYPRGDLPVELTLGALVVLDAAHTSQQDGTTPRQALGHAARAAGRFLDLLPGPTVAAAAAG